MLNFKQSIILGLTIFFIQALFSFLLLSQRIETSLYVATLQYTTYLFVFSILLFYPLIEIFTTSFIALKRKSVLGYIKWKMMEYMKMYAIVFLVFTLLQILLYGAMDSYFRLNTLLYRNLVFFILILFVSFVSIVGSQKHRRMKLVLLFLLWNFLCLMLTSFSESMFNQYNIFTLLQGIHLVDILKYSMLLIILIGMMFIRMRDKGRYMKKWIE